MFEAPPTLFLVRHGQTAWNVQRRVLGRTDIPLDDTGKQQAGGLRARLGAVDAVWTSPLSRARETASALDCSVPPRVHHGLVEMDQGELDGLGEAELTGDYATILRQWREDPSGLRLPGGETMDEVRDRGMAALAEIAQASSGRVAVVTHQLVIATVLCALAQEPLSRWRLHTHPNCAWTEVCWGAVPRVVAERVSPGPEPSR